MWYREDKAGQILQEGITEAGSMCSWIAAGTSYSTHGVQTLPFFIFYSMFGFQRIGDFAWAAGDMRTRGFLLGGTSGRTTLNGEGLQHEDGHSHLFAAAIPNCVPYDPTYAYEVATIVQDGVRRMLGEQEDVYYYITLLNENYQHPALPAGAEDGILRGMYLLRDGGRAKKGQPRVQLMGSGSILREVLAAADLLRDDWGVVADVWSATSFTLLHRDGESAARWNLLHPTETPQRAYVEQQLDGHDGPGDRRDRLREVVRRADPAVRRRAQVPRARHRRLRAQRHAQATALVLRGRPPLGRARGAQGAGGRRHDRPREGRGRDRALRHRREQARADDGLAAMAHVDLTVPDLGGFNDIPVIEVLVKPGDTVAKDAPLVTLESDKATMEVPASAGGVVKDIRVKVGDKVSQGTVLVTVESADGAMPAGGAPTAGVAAPHPAKDPVGVAAADAGAAEESGAPPPPRIVNDGAPAAGTETVVDLVVPDIGDFKDIPVIEVLVQPGDTVAKEAALVSLESDKATMEVPASAGGTIRDVRVKVGDKVSQGTVIATVATHARRSVRTDRGAPNGRPPVATHCAAAAAARRRTARRAPRPHTPRRAVRCMRRRRSAASRASSASISRSVRGSGPNGRITRDDVQGFVKTALVSPPSATARERASRWYRDRV